MTSPAAFQRALGGPPPRERWRWSLADLAGLVALVVVLAIAVPAWARTEGGRARLAREIERALGEGIRGDVSIGRLDHIGLDGVAGREIVFSDESGRPVLEAEAVELEIDWSELVRGHFVSPRGRVHGGRVWIETTPAGELLVDRAFESPAPGPPGQPIGDDVVRLERLAADDVEVIVRITGAPRVRATDLSTICVIRAPEHGAALLRADRIDAGMRIDAPIPIELDIEDGSFELDGASRRRVHVVFPTLVNDHEVGMVVRVRADAQENMHVHLVLTPSSGGAALVSGTMIAQALAADALADALEVTVRAP